MKKIDQNSHRIDHRKSTKNLIGRQKIYQNWGLTPLKTVEIAAAHRVIAICFGKFKFTEINCDFFCLAEFG